MPESNINYTAAVITLPYPGAEDFILLRSEAEHPGESRLIFSSRELIFICNSGAPVLLHFCTGNKKPSRT